MYLHLGGDYVVKKSEIISILNLDCVSLSSMQDLLKSIGEKKEIIGLSPETKSIVITERAIYASPISSLTLLKRATQLVDLSK
ncbi:MAG TPA: DUF370 domain-containing protein [Firmicutes bacterium]|jgi:hypothetical protein|nr:DUF370 domain-containing protein [Bacillota bacterium]HOQ24713.1 DUF370 domain-containing protein [Bacillota bacterium]HPT67735.1 DUF370 domain-containing protein [Bacillota bacterium]